MNRQESYLFFNQEKYMKQIWDLIPNSLESTAMKKWANRQWRKTNKERKILSNSNHFNKTNRSEYSDYL